METLIHCPECHEDMNSADWEANNSCCTHCGSEVGSWHEQRREYDLKPLARVHRRLELAPFLRNYGQAEVRYA